MGLIRLGLRRLYDALACGFQDGSEIETTTSVSSKRWVRIYIGPNPPCGVTFVQSGERYCVPGERGPIIQVEHRPAAESSYPRRFFTEILCWEEVQLDDDLKAAFEANNAAVNAVILDMATSLHSSFREDMDLIAGSLGLRFHPQFTLVQMSETPVALRGEHDFAWTHSSLEIQNLEVVVASRSIEAVLGSTLTHVGSLIGKKRRIASRALFWLLRAWTARDDIEKFMAMFIPLEVILDGYTALPPHRVEWGEKIRELIQSSVSHDRGELAKILDEVLKNNRPTLASRFETLAIQANFYTMEQDIVAFRKFYKIRNKLVHYGVGEVRLAVMVTDTEVSDLEDLVERYINFVVFADQNVYASIWKPQR